MTTRHWLVPVVDTQRSEPVVGLVTLNLSDQEFQTLHDAFENTRRVCPNLLSMSLNVPDCVQTAVLRIKDVTEAAWADVYDDVLIEDACIELPQAPPAHHLRMTGDTLDSLLVEAQGLYFKGASSTITWPMVGVHQKDSVRCRYRDCSEAHPVALEHQLVTCRSCRKTMGLG